MSQFYNRYVPPNKENIRQTSIESAHAEKRKRSEKTNGLRETAKRNKKRRVTEEREDREPAEDPLSIAYSTGEKNGALSGGSILDKYSISNFANSQNGGLDVKLKKGNQRKSNETRTQDDVPDRSPTPVQRAGRKMEVTKDDQEYEGDDKHTNIFSRYEKSKRWSELNDSEGVGQGDLSDHFRQENVHGLVPIPQPDTVDTVPKVPAYSTLPTWQAAATNAVPSNTATFQSLGLSIKVISNLKAQGIDQAFTIQSTVIPLLLDGVLSHDGDLCVSAATGSGKTLAYVVPIIESLRKQNRSGLRAVIVVPTRELVKQVRETCEICAAGSNLNTVTAVGSKSLLEEQKALVLEEEVYDVQAYQKELNTPIDWSTFSLEKTLQRAQTRDSWKIANYVTQRSLKADILVTTPGRLVDHLQNTEGFHLNDVQWLVVDEADRLLNESYQEWIDVVVPALKSRKATEQLDTILSRMRIELPPRIVKKVLLSATMTRDISQLNRIGLENPRLVVLEGSKDEINATRTAASNIDLEEPVADTAGKYTLPTSLHEVAATFKEGSDKPLLLLHILRMHMNIPSGPQLTSSPSAAGSGPSFDTEEYTSSSGSDSDSSSASEHTGSGGDETSGSSSTSSSESARRKPKPKVTSRRRLTSPPLSSYHGSRVLIFTRSTASASRLTRLLSIVAPELAPKLATLTRSTSASASSRKALSAFRSGRSPILIATDRASRGIDVPGLDHVVSYDIPGSALTYVHRVGRTARAGQEGQAWTLVEHREGRWFWNEIGGKSNECVIERNGKVKKMNVAVEDEVLRKKYEAALQTLGAEVRGE